MAKKKHGFLIGMLVYALVFLLLVAGGLVYFWNYLAAYESARPQLAAETYLENLSPEHICDASAELIGSIDHSLQSEEACRQAILDALSEPITCSRLVSECTDERLVFVLRCGPKVIGKVQMVPSGEKKLGFSPWVLEQEEFDLKYLLSEPVELTVPAEYGVFCGGQAVDASHIVEADIPYKALAAYSGRYELPTMVRYRIGPTLGTLPVEIRNPQGQAVDPSAGEDEFLNNCSPEQAAALEQSLGEFLDYYVRFMSNQGNNAENNYEALRPYLLPDSDLDRRCYNAITGLYWVENRSATVESIDLRRCISLGQGKFLCDLRYVINNFPAGNEPQSTSDVQIVFSDSDGRYLAELLTNA